MSRTRPSRWLPGIVSALSLAVAAGPASPVDEEAPGQKPSEAPVQDALDESRAVQREGNVEGVASQERIDEISDETDQLFARYSTVLRQVDSTRVYNRQMEELVASQEDELASLAAQLEQVEEVGRSITPLMLRMIASLEAFVELDVPFLIEERTARVQGLREMMNRADVTNSEKFRRIMEAFQIENEFGRTIETYRSTLAKDGRELSVNFLRFGRIALLYQTMNESEAGMWNQETRSWDPLSSGYRSAIRQGLRIARKQAAPDLIRLPLPAAQPMGGPD
jgi:hypothetical protein